MGTLETPFGKMVGFRSRTNPKQREKQDVLKAASTLLILTSIFRRPLSIFTFGHKDLSEHTLMKNKSYIRAPR